MLSDEKIKGNLFDEDNEEDTNELKKIQSLLSQSKENIEENDDNNNDLNNKTNVSDRDNIYENELKDANKSKENNNDENELSETYLTNKNSCDGEENSQLKSEDNIEITLKINSFNIIQNYSHINKSSKNDNKLNKNNNINLFKNEIELNINKNININNPKQILNKNILDNQEYLLNEKEESEKDNKKIEKKNKHPIFLIRKIKKRSKKIQFLRKKKGIHLIRKKDSDIIRKKIKTYFHNYLIDKLNFEIKIINWKKFVFDLNDNLFPKKVKKKKVNKFLKFNNKFTTNVSINLNRNLLLKKIYQILIEQPISTKYKAFHLKNNSYLTKYLLSLKNIPNIHKILNSTYEDFYKEFLKSPHFQKILEHIKKKDGIFYLNNFKKVSFNLISFYKKGRQKNSLKKEKNKGKFLLVKNINNDKEESKGSKKSKKSRRSISFFLHNKTPNSSDENKFKNYSSFYLHSINSKNNIISLIEDYQSFNVFSKEESEHLLLEKSYLFKDLYEISNVNSFLKVNEENSDEPKEYKIADDMNNLSIIKKLENEKGENEIFNEFMKININT